MALVIETVNYSHLTGNPDLRNGVGEFEMDVTYPFEQTTFFTDIGFETHKAWLETRSSNPRSFIVGAMTKRLDPGLRRLPDVYANLIESIHKTLEMVGVETYSCFRRERFGTIGITSEHATILDRLALDTSHFLTMLPGASDSGGTWKEIVHATKAGTHIVGLFNEQEPELEFRDRIMEAAAVHGARSSLVFVTFGSHDELVSGLTQVATTPRIIAQ